MDLQHHIAKNIAKKLGLKNEEKENQLWIIYGIEVFLNEFFKLICALILGIVFHILPEVIFSTILLLTLRHFAGGRHFKNNFICFIVSVFTLFFPGIVIPYISISNKKIIFISILEIILFMIYAPFPNEARKKFTVVKIIKEKILSIFLLLVSLAIGLWIQKKYCYIGLIIGIVEIISIIRFPVTSKKEAKAS